MNNFEGGNVGSSIEQKEKLRKILLVEDEKLHHSSLELLCRNNSILLHAYNLNEAEKLLKENSDIDLILVDGCLNPNGELDTPPFVENARSNGFNGRMVAMSSSAKFNKRLIEAGCDESCPKTELMSFLLNFLSPENPKNKEE